MQDFSFALTTDIHYGDKPDKSDEYKGEGMVQYRAGLNKVRRAVQELGSRRVPLWLLLGDTVESYGAEEPRRVERTRKDLRTLEAVLDDYPGERFYLMGNHDLLDLSKRDFLGYTGGRVSATRYSFDRGPLHFAVLDANFRSDGVEYARGDFDWRQAYLPSDQIAWLEADLKAASDRPAIVLCHQCLDDESSDFGVKNAHEVRAVLEKMGNVAAVIQGHRHAPSLTEKNGIHYATMAPMLDGPGPEGAYAVATWRAESGRLEIRGLGPNQPDWDIKPQ